MPTSVQSKDSLDPAQDPLIEPQPTAAESDTADAAPAAAEAAEATAEVAQTPPSVNLLSPSRGDSFGIDDTVSIDYEVGSDSDCAFHYTLHDASGNLIDGFDDELRADRERGTAQGHTSLWGPDLSLGGGKYQLRYWATNDFGRSEVQSIEIELVDPDRAIPDGSDTLAANDSGSGDDAGA
jgi:hypothetical protein